MRSLQDKTNWRNPRTSSI